MLDDNRPARDRGAIMFQRSSPRSTSGVVPVQGVVQTKERRGARWLSTFVVDFSSITSKGPWVDGPPSL